MRLAAVSTHTLFACSLFGLAACGGSGQQDQEAAAAQATPSAQSQPASIREAYLTSRDEGDNVDSVAVWHAPDGQHWLLATAKESDALIVYDAATGEIIRRAGEEGTGLGALDRPNGIAVRDGHAFVVERNNRRVQVFTLPGLQAIGAFGDQVLRWPYGIWLHRLDSDRYRVFVTDAYETADEGIPADGQLGERVKRFELRFRESGMDVQAGDSFGATEGAGVLHQVESLYGDPEYDRLLVADESEQDRDIKLYDLQGQFSGEVMGKGRFRFEPEGIALYRCAEGAGYWFTTDQDEQDNRFDVYDRKTLAFIGSFQGAVTRNTDGVALTQRAMPGFPKGAFYAVHDDGNVGAFDLAEVLEALGVDACAAPE